MVGTAGRERASATTAAARMPRSLGPAAPLPAPPVQTLLSFPSLFGQTTITIIAIEGSTFEFLPQVEGRGTKTVQTADALRNAVSK